MKILRWVLPVTLLNRIPDFKGILILSIFVTIGFFCQLGSHWLSYSLLIRKNIIEYGDAFEIGEYDIGKSNERCQKLTTIAERMNESSLLLLGFILASQIRDNSWGSIIASNYFVRSY